MFHFLSNPFSKQSDEELGVGAAWSDRQNAVWVLFDVVNGDVDEAVEATDRWGRPWSEGRGWVSQGP